MKHLAEEYPLDIRYHHVVKSIEKTNTSIGGIGGIGGKEKGNKHNSLLIECTNGSVIEADRCIITVPIGVLKKKSPEEGGVEFVPSRPPEITKLCQELGSGLMNIVWLWYPTFFWPRDKGYPVCYFSAYVFSCLISS